MNTTKSNKIKLSELENGKTFIVDGVEYIKFAEKDREVIVLTKDILFNSDFGDNNDLTKSKVLKKLQDKVLPKIEAAIGADNVVEFETDLTTLDGLKTYGKLRSKISIPTLDFYRENIDIFDKHKIKNWFWLATADSTKEHGSNIWVLCVAPSGDIDLDFYDDHHGVRPILCFKSSILISYEG